MAFDHPIEADRIDDLGLFSAFIRAPVVGTLMWVLGGSKAMEEEEKEKELMLIDGEDDGTSTSRSTRHVLNMEEVNGKLKKTAPRLIGSDISEFGECAAEAEALALQRSSSLRRSSSKGLRKSRKMSWSDESGQNLCEYIEESTTPYEPKKLSITSSSNAKPIKSAMRRTSSVNEVASDLSQTSITSKQRYLPNGLGAGHSGLVMPTKPGDVAAGGPSHGPGGYHSPEWGWYINTTPPTPEMFHSQYSSTRGKLLSSKDPSQSHVPSSGPPAFTPGISTSSKTGMGWPSVPL